MGFADNLNALPTTPQRRAATAAACLSRQKCQPCIRPNLSATDPVCTVNDGDRFSRHSRAEIGLAPHPARPPATPGSLPEGRVFSARAATGFTQVICHGRSHTQLPQARCSGCKRPIPASQVANAAVSISPALEAQTPVPQSLLAAAARAADPLTAASATCCSRRSLRRRSPFRILVGGADAAKGRASNRRRRPCGLTGRRRWGHAFAMARIVFTANLRRHVDCPAAAADGETVREALEAIFRANERLRGYVLDDQSAAAPPHGDRRRRPAARRPRRLERPDRHRPAQSTSCKLCREASHERPSGRFDPQGSVLGRAGRATAGGSRRPTFSATTSPWRSATPAAATTTPFSTTAISASSCIAGTRGVWEEIAAPAYPPKPEGLIDRDGWGKDIPYTLINIFALEPGGAKKLASSGAAPFRAACSARATMARPGSSIRSLWDHPNRQQWMGGGTDWPAIHSICVDPRDSADRAHRAYPAAASGKRATAAKAWTCRADGMFAAYLPPDMGRDPNTQDPHCLVQSPSEPDRLWVQHHNGIFRSDDGSATWSEIAGVQPSSFGFAVAVHPREPDTAWFVPAIKDERRIPVDGELVVSRTRDARPVLRCPAQRPAAEPRLRCRLSPCARRRRQRRSPRLRHHDGRTLCERGSGRPLAGGQPHPAAGARGPVRRLTARRPLSLSHSTGRFRRAWERA